MSEACGFGAHDFLCGVEYLASRSLDEKKRGDDLCLVELFFVLVITLWVEFAYRTDAPNPLNRRYGGAGSTAAKHFADKVEPIY